MVERGTLRSWTDGPTKDAIRDLVQRLSDETHVDYVAPSARIATVDNDGTLWCERPVYVQAAFLIARFRELAEADPARATVQPYLAASTGDLSYFAHYQEHLAELAGAIAEAYAGITPEDFEAVALAFFDRARHPRFGVPYHHIVYRPMIELLDLLRAHGFAVYIATGGGRDFVRAIAEERYGVPRANVIGSAGGIAYRDGQLVRLPTITMPIDDGPGKPVYIHNRTGQRPALAIGNSDGDRQMLEFSRFGVLIHHDDADREYAYDEGAEHVLALASERHWQVVSMKRDWATIFDQ